MLVLEERGSPKPRFAINCFTCLFNTTTLFFFICWAISGHCCCQSFVFSQLMEKS